MTPTEWGVIVINNVKPETSLKLDKVWTPFPCPVERSLKTIKTVVLLNIKAGR